MGRFLGLTAREVNKLLLDKGFLEGNPGAYGLTDKGEEYGGEEHQHDNGYGGYAHRYWETRTWDSKIIALLREWNLHDFDWYCDNCDAFMNVQPGFEGVEAVWVCAECGTENGIGPSDLR